MPTDPTQIAFQSFSETDDEWRIVVAAPTRRRRIEVRCPSDTTPDEIHAAAIQVAEAIRRRNAGRDGG